MKTNCKPCLAVTLNYPDFFFEKKTGLHVVTFDPFGD